jgi:hypothetical protein
MPINVWLHRFFMQDRIQLACNQICTTACTECSNLPNLGSPQAWDVAAGLNSNNHATQAIQEPCADWQRDLKTCRQTLHPDLDVQRRCSVTVLAVYGCCNRQTINTGSANGICNVASCFHHQSPALQY